MTDRTRSFEQVVAAIAWLRDCAEHEAHIAADALEQANLKVAKLQAELDASLRENANLKTMNQEGGDHLANATDDCISEMRRANRAEQKLEKIREWGRSSGITIPQEESLAALLDPVQTEGEE